jgi:hypothetical protein
MDACCVLGILQAKIMVVRDIERDEIEFISKVAVGPESCVAKVPSAQMHLQLGVRCVMLWYLLYITLQTVVFMVLTLNLLSTVCTHRPWGACPLHTWIT